MAKIKGLQSGAKIKISKNCWDRDYTLDLILQKIEQLNWHAKEELVKEAFEIYKEVQGYKYTGPDVDELEMRRKPNLKVVKDQ